MNELLKSFLFQICCIGVSCYFLAFITRRIFEAGFTCLKMTGDPKQPYKNAAARWWNEVILYAIPVLYGVGLCMLLRLTSFFPEEFRSVPAALILGIALGFMSGFLYKVMKRLILREAGVDKEDDLPVATVPEPPK